MIHPWKRYGLHPSAAPRHNFSTFESENSALGAELVEAARSQG